MPPILIGNTSNKYGLLHSAALVPTLLRPTHGDHLQPWWLVLAGCEGSKSQQ